MKHLPRNKANAHFIDFFRRESVSAGLGFEALKLVLRVHRGLLRKTLARSLLVSVPRSRHALHSIKLSHAFPPGDPQQPLTYHSFCAAAPVVSRSRPARDLLTRQRGRRGNCRGPGRGTPGRC